MIATSVRLSTTSGGPGPREMEWTMAKTSGVAMTVVGSLMVTAATAAAQVQQITCESTDSKYRYCAVKTDNEVRMLRQISGERCEQGKSWGYDKEGVWVDLNCAAEFRVGRSGPSTSQKIAAGAAAGAAMLQAMLGGQTSAAQASAAPPATGALPPWVVGTFQAQHPKTEQQYYITIDSQGVLDGRVNDKEFFGRVKGERIYVGALVLGFRQEGDGFVAFEPGKESEGVPFSRVQ
jgi:hypothetical protein